MECVEIVEARVLFEFGILQRLPSRLTAVLPRSYNILVAHTWAIRFLVEDRGMRHAHFWDSA